MSSAYRKPDTGWQHGGCLDRRMPYREPARTAAGRRRSTTLFALVVVSAAHVGVLAYQSLGSSSFSAASRNDDLLDLPAPAVTGIEAEQRTPPRPRRQADLDRKDRWPPGMGLGEADGVLPDGVTVFDDHYPAVTNLDPALLRAVRRAATDAAEDGVKFYVDSGWRSTRYQEQLLREAVSEYGSEEEAARWVATPDTSAHVSGDAIDVGPFDATAWLSEHGATYGLCQIYSNEPWHYELRPKAVDLSCPRMYADPTHDPRMQQ